jgi:hypothetical protein
MGLTLSDINRRIYAKFRSEGLSHDEAMEKFPDRARTRISNDLEKGDFESHFGMKPKSFLTLFLFISFWITALILSL